jgi:hypothetical protein
MLACFQPWTFSKRFLEDGYNNRFWFSNAGTLETDGRISGCRTCQKVCCLYCWLSASPHCVSPRTLARFRSLSPCKLLVWTLPRALRVVHTWTASLCARPPHRRYTGWSSGKQGCPFEIISLVSTRESLWHFPLSHHVLTNKFACNNTKTAERIFVKFGTGKF